ncbi:MAG TPA: ParB/RepB/Spo0J family partition protein [Candidatus Pelagibacter bacterium]|jgi:ParB family chromosome partitioning protein|nr:ParB/RepB/Spo0J family partition protein [Candidatus Pelagibacter bacterium]|tara:strand:- start:332 stop:1180 length:849 start_codon:yes stop_codon:yes gene_type:complete
MDAFKIRKGLGRGLSSLIGDNKTNTNIKKLLITDLVRNRFQPRKNFDKENLVELSNSIKERGVIQPIIVRESRDHNNKYEIIAGERRWLAAQNAGLNELPVVIIEANDLKSLEFAIVENVQRHDLNSVEEANGYQRLIDDFGYDHEKVAKFIGKSRSHISNCLRLLTLPKEVIELIEKNNLSQGHAKVLVGLSNAFFLAKKIMDKKLSVRQAENLVRLFKSKKMPKYISKDPNLKQIESTLKDKIGLNTFIKNKKNNTGLISFEYKDLDQLNRIIDVIKSNY